MQLKTPDRVHKEANYREIRQAILAGACGAEKNNFPDLEIIVGILIEPPKLSDDLAEDFAVLYCKTWSNEDKKYYEDIANEFGFFKTAEPHFKTIQEFVSENGDN